MKTSLVECIYDALQSNVKANKSSVLTLSIVELYNKCILEDQD